MRSNHTDLLQSLAGQVCLCHCESITLCSEVSHLTVGGPVMQSHSGQVVESFVQVVGHIGCKDIKNKTSNYVSYALDTILVFQQVSALHSALM